MLSLGALGNAMEACDMSAHNALHETEVVVRGSGSGFAQEISARSHRLVADEPIPNGGTDTGPTPYDLLLAALGS
jgi:putative redox protein